MPVMHTDMSEILFPQPLLKTLCMSRGLGRVLKTWLYTLGTGEKLQPLPSAGQNAPNQLQHRSQCFSGLSCSFGQVEESDQCEIQEKIKVGNKLRS